MSDAGEFGRNMVAVLAADGGRDASETDNALKMGVRTVFDAIGKVSEPRKRPVGERGGRGSSRLTPDEESAFLDDFAEKTPEGAILAVPELHEAFMVKTGKKARPSTIHGFSNATDGERQNRTPVIPGPTRKNGGNSKKNAQNSIGASLFKKPRGSSRFGRFPR
jgi:hypothetical protein